MGIRRRCEECKQFDESTIKRIVTCGDDCRCEYDEWLCDPCARKKGAEGS